MQLTDLLSKGLKLTAALGVFLLSAQPLQAEDSASSSKRRAQTFSQAINKASRDGVIIFQYGPDWNERSLRMSKDFWKSAEVEAASGNAMLLAAPIYQRPNQAQREYQWQVTSGMPAITDSKAHLCPALIFIDQRNRVYAFESGMDIFGDETGQKALEKIRYTIGLLRRQQELVSRIQLSSSSDERLRLLVALHELPIPPPFSVKDRIQMEDPSDKHGYLKRITFNTRQTISEQFDSSDKIFYKDYKKACLQIANNTKLRARDRQLAYCLLIGQSMLLREDIPGQQIKRLFTDCSKLDPSSNVAKIAPSLAAIWIAQKERDNAELRKNARIERKAQLQERRAQRKESKQQKDDEQTDEADKSKETEKSKDTSKGRDNAKAKDSSRTK